MWEWCRIVAGYRNRQTEFWRMVRQVITLNYNLNVEKKDRKDAEELMPLPGDERTLPTGNAGLPPELFIQMLNTMHQPPLN